MGESGHADDRIETWRRLTDDTADTHALLDAVGSGDPTDVATLSRLRARWTPDLIAAAIELVRARVRAARKFPEPTRLVADVIGVEQATSHAVAEHKAVRFRERRPAGEPIADLCCGIGGDAMSLARVGPVTAIDHDPLRAWMAGHNAGCTTIVADVEKTSLEWPSVHVDPSRRTDDRRHWPYEDYRPGPAFIERLLATCPDAAVKLGPGVDLDALPASGREVEIINERGTLVQAVLWSGRLARHPDQRTATRLPDEVTFTGRPTPLAEEGPDAFGRFLFVPDPAIERAGLVGTVCAMLPVRGVHPGLGILTSDEPVESAWLERYLVVDDLPWRVERVRERLADLDAGIVTVRTRGGAVETDRAQRELRGDGSRALTVFGLRRGRRITAIVTEPC